MIFLLVKLSGRQIVVPAIDALTREDLTLLDPIEFPPVSAPSWLAATAVYKTQLSEAAYAAQTRNYS